MVGEGQGPKPSDVIYGWPLQCQLKTTKASITQNKPLQTVFLGRLPNEKALKAFDMLVRILQSKGILDKCVTLVGKSDVVHRGDDSPGTKLVEYWSKYSPYWHQNCTIN